MRTLPDYADNDDSVVASVSNSDLVAKVQLRTDTFNEGHSAASSFSKTGIIVQSLYSKFFVFGCYTPYMSIYHTLLMPEPHSHILHKSYITIAKKGDDVSEKLLRELIAHEEFANMNKTDSDEPFRLKKA